MTADEINILRALSDGRWRTAMDVSIVSGVRVIKAAIRRTRSEWPV